MAKSEAKTKANDGDVNAFLAKVADEQQRADSMALLKLLNQVTRREAKMWGTSIIGFGSYHYTYASGREGDWPIAAFSPRKSAISIYVMCGFEGLSDELSQLGKHKTGKCCLYVKRLGDIDQKVLKSILRKSVQYMRKHYPCA